MPKTLTLSIDSYAVVIDTFAQNGYERTRADTGETEYSIWGTPLDSGPFFEPKFIWIISCYLSKEEWIKLNAIFSLSDKRRRQMQNYRITINDYIEEIIEDSPRTRAVASGGSVNTAGNSVYYPAKFYARMFEPKSTQQGGLKLYLTSFTLKELDKFNA